MASKGAEAGKAFLTSVLGKITDAAQRAAAEALLASDVVLTEIGGGVLAQSEVSRQMQELADQRAALEARNTELTTHETNLTTWRDNLTSWHTANKDALEEYKTLKANGGKPVVPTTVTPPAGGITQEALDERLGNERAAVLGFTRDSNQIQREHFAKFNEIVDMDALLRHPQISTLGLIGTYELVHKPRLEAWDTAAKTKHEEAIRLDERKKVHAEQATMPYPSPTGAGSGSPLDALTPSAPTALVDASVAHYQRLQAERGGAPG